MVTPKIGIVGVGNMGRIHARILRDMRALAGVVDKDMSKAELVARNHGVQAFESYDKMIDQAGLDGIVISTPTSTHAKIVEDIAKRDSSIRALLIEKPLASTLKDARRVANILRKRNIVSLVSHSEIYNPVVNRALSLISDGAIGEVQSVIYDRRGFVQPERIPSLGDVFEDIGVHDFDIMSRISEGSAKLYAQCNMQGGMFNAATVMVKFKSDTVHFFHLSRQYAGRRRSLDASGTKGALVLDLFGQIIRVQDLSQEPLSDSRTIKLPERGATIKVYGEPVQEVITDFLYCMETGADPRVGLADGIRALEVVEAARKSASSGQVIELNLSRGV